ncbi:MAG TPA: hypothetical protein VFP54_05650 [Acidimicrobiales bacterium]|nr:hypothetical protein [Acidimicrobiales bacterium]
MLSRRLFEGPDIEKLLARIQSDLGASAKVISAEKVRRGGVGGFFARETYQVVVEAPEAPPRQLLRGARRKQHALTGPADAGPADTGTPDAVSVPSTEGATFAELLNRLTQDAAAPAGAHSEQEGLAPPADPARVDTVVDEDLTAVLTALDAGMATAGASTVTVEAEPALGEPEWQAAEAWLSEVGGEPPAASFEQPGESSGVAPTSMARLQPVPLPVEDPAAVLAALTPTGAKPALRRMGLPTSFLPGDDRADLVQALYRSLSRLPAAPAVRLQPGDVMAVIGDAQRAQQLAARLALSIGLDPSSVVVASLETGLEGARLVLGSGDAAEAAAEEWATMGQPTVVSISAAPGSGRESWAGSLLGALQPAAIWGVVEATRKPEDVAAWSRAIGHVDALALEDLDATTTPAAVLSTGIPVALIDGQLASAEAWTALLSARLRMAA